MLDKSLEILRKRMNILILKSFRSNINKSHLIMNLNQILQKCMDFYQMIKYQQYSYYLIRRERSKEKDQKNLNTNPISSFLVSNSHNTSEIKTIQSTATRKPPLGSENVNNGNQHTLSPFCSNIQMLSGQSRSTSISKSNLFQPYNLIECRKDVKPYLVTTKIQSISKCISCSHCKNSLCKNCSKSNNTSSSALPQRQNKLLPEKHQALLDSVNQIFSQKIRASSAFNSTQKEESKVIFLDNFRDMKGLENQKKENNSIKDTSFYSKNNLLKWHNVKASCEQQQSSYINSFSLSKTNISSCENSCPQTQRDSHKVSNNYAQVDSKLQQQTFKNQKLMNYLTEESNSQQIPVEDREQLLLNKQQIPVQDQEKGFNEQYNSNFNNNNFSNRNFNRLSNEKDQRLKDLAHQIKIMNSEPLLLKERKEQLTEALAKIGTYFITQHEDQDEVNTDIILNFIYFFSLNSMNSCLLISNQSFQVIIKLPTFKIILLSNIQLKIEIISRK